MILYLLQVSYFFLTFALVNIKYGANIGKFNQTCKKIIKYFASTY